MTPNGKGYKAYLEGYNHGRNMRWNALNSGTIDEIPSPYEGGQADWWRLGYKDGVNGKVPRYRK